MQASKGTVNTAQIATSYSAAQGIPVPSGATTTLDADAAKMRQAVGSSMVSIDESVVAAAMDSLGQRGDVYEVPVDPVVENARYIEQAIQNSTAQMAERERENAIRARDQQYQMLGSQITQIASRGDEYDAMHMAKHVVKRSPGTYTVHWTLRAHLESTLALMKARGDTQFKYDSSGMRLGKCKLTDVDVSRVNGNGIYGAKKLKDFGNVRLLHVGIKSVKGAHDTDLKVVFPALRHSKKRGNGGVCTVHQHGTKILVREVGEEDIFLSPDIAAAILNNARQELASGSSEEDTAAALAEVSRRAKMLLNYIKNTDGFVEHMGHVYNVYVERPDSTGTQLQSFIGEAELFAELYRQFNAADAATVASPISVGGNAAKWYIISENYWKIFMGTVEKLAVVDMRSAGEEVYDNMAQPVGVGNLADLLRVAFTPVPCPGNLPESDFVSVSSIIDSNGNILEPIKKRWNIGDKNMRDHFVVHGTATFFTE